MNITEKEVIARLQGLKHITPTKEWVALSKMNILASTISKKEADSAPLRQSTFSTFSNLFYQKKLVYSLAAFLFVAIGVVGFMKVGLPQGPAQIKSAEQTAAAESSLKDSVANFTAKSQNLAQLIKDKPQDVTVALNEVKSAAKNLTDNMQKNPELVKNVALDINNNSKTYLDITPSSQGDDLKQVSDTVYKALVEQLIKDEQGMTLTADQQMVLDNVIALSKQGKDSDALVNMLLLIHSTDGKDEAGK